jgi:6-pyruvoyl-tetrahydropterin synthase
MSINSSIIVNDATVIDFAYIDAHGRLRGNSMNYSFAVSGQTSSHEKVVVDFSSIKKSIKQYIDLSNADNRLNGFDHKLWIIQGLSQCELVKLKDRYVITTPCLKLELPFDAVKSVPIIDLDNKNEVEHMLTRDLQSKLGHKIQLQSFIDFGFKSRFNQPLIGFSYVHGLKDSTSYGCQNIAHGHYSYLQLLSKAENDSVKTLRKQIVIDLNDKILINKENILDDTQSTLLLSYTTERGLFRLELNKALNSYILFDTETTIEFIGQYILDMYRDELKEAGVYAFVVSEGLNKGAYVDI